jgi:predicted AlkP superfamily phosphohydrolase/phosphomutase
MITQREKDKLMKEVDLAFENLPDTNTEDYNEKVFSENDILGLYDSIEAIVNPKRHFEG